MKTSIINLCKKKSFWVSVVAVLCSFGLAISPELRESISNLAVSVAELVESICRENPAQE